MRLESSAAAMLLQPTPIPIHFRSRRMEEEEEEERLNEECQKEGNEAPLGLCLTTDRRMLLRRSLTTEICRSMSVCVNRLSSNSLFFQEKTAMGFNLLLHGRSSFIVWVWPALMTLKTVQKPNTKKRQILNTPIHTHMYTYTTTSPQLEGWIHVLNFSKHSIPHCKSCEQWPQTI